MKNFVVIFFALAIPVRALSQDDQYMQQAVNALSVKRCGEALASLRRVSANGQKTPAYNLQMGRVNDCQANIAQAIYYYNKYLETDQDDSVKKRVAELTIEKEKQNKAGNESHAAKDLYQTTSHNKKKRRQELDGNYSCFGIGYGSALSSDAPYRSVFELNGDGGFPVANNKILLEATINADFLSHPSSPWFNNALQFRPYGTSSASGGYCYNAALGIMPVIINKKRVCLAAGPLIGGALTDLPDPGEYSFTNSNFFSGYYGVRTNLFLSGYLVIYLQYANITTASETVQAPGRNTLSVPCNYGTVLLGVRLRTGSWGSGWRGWGR